MTLEGLAKSARQFANELFHNAEAVGCTEMARGGESCLHKEEERPLTRQEKALGWVRRPFEAYHPDRLCGGCRSYFYAELAAQTLHRLHCLQVREEAGRGEKVG